MRIGQVIQSACASYVGCMILVVVFIIFLLGPLGYVLGSAIHALSCAGVYCAS